MPRVRTHVALSLALAALLGGLSISAFRRRAAAEESLDAAVESQLSAARDLAKLRRGLRHAGSTAQQRSLRRRERAEEISLVARNAALAERRLAMIERADGIGVLERVVLEAGVAGALAWLFLAFVLQPVGLLETAARQWRPGTPWPASSAAVPELRELLSRLDEMTRRINAQIDEQRQDIDFKTRLVSLAGHEFGNSISVILNAAYVLEHRAQPGDRDRDAELYRMIAMHAQMLASISGNFLALNKSQTKSLAARPEPVDLGPAVQAIAERMQSFAREKGVALRLDLPERPPRVYADRVGLDVVLNNLISNGIKYTAAGGTVCLSIRPTDGDGFILAVSDTGIGMRDGDRERALQGRFRADDAVRMSPKGYGIGLSLARAVVEAHGSRLHLETSPGKGSTFWFELPARAPAPTQLSA